MGAAAGPDQLVVPRAKVKEKDVIGAADAFVGGFVGAAMKGLPAFDCVLWAHAAGTLSTQMQGAQESLPSEEKVLAFLD